MKRSDIPDEHVVELARNWAEHNGPGVIEALMAEGVPEKLAIRKVEHLVDRDILEFGGTPYYAWPVKKVEK